MKKIITVFFTIISAINIAQIPNYIPTNGLIGWWPFNGNANDLSGNNLNGNIIGALPTTDRFGLQNSAYFFNYTHWTWATGGDEIFIPYNSILNTSSLTVSVWVNRNSNGYPNQQLTIINRFQFGYSNPYGEHWQLVANPAPSCQILSQILQSASVNSICTSSNLPLNNWIHIAFTFNGNVIKNYVNGILTNTLLTNNLNLNTNGNSGISIGVSDQANGHWGPFDGKIDDIGIWNRALTACEINQLYTSSISTISIQASSNTICVGQTASLNVTGANTYTWSTNQNTAGITLTPSISTNYSVIGTNSAGCTPTAAINISVNPLPIISINSGTICNSQSYTLVPNGANTYTISGGNTIISPSITTSYSVTGTSTAGCISASAAVATVTVFALPQISVNSGTICNSQSFTLVPIGANTYTISGGNTIISPSITTSYSVTGTSTAGCISASAAVATVSVNQNPILSITGNTLLCTGETGTITVSGANAYAWSNGATSTSITINNTPNTYNYTVTGTGTNSCTASTTVQVLINACTSIAQNQNKYLDIYPNPASSLLNIGASDQAIGKTLKIFDAQSKLIQVLVLKTNNVLQLSDWAKGIYLIQVSELGISKRIVIE